jgi:hypothetical protein
VPGVSWFPSPTAPRSRRGSWWFPPVTAARWPAFQHRPCAAPPLQRFLHPSPARPAVLRNSILAQQPLDSQPGRSLAGRLQILRPTAPPVFPQRLLRRQQLRPRRIEMHLIAHRLQKPVAAAVHDQRLVPSAEQMSDDLVPPCLRAARIGRPLRRPQNYQYY